MAVGLAENETTSPATKAVECHQVSLPPTVPATVLPLTFCNVLFMGSVERLFLGSVEHQCTDNSTANFLSTHLPALRHSLSFTLQSFFSFAGKISPSPATGEFVIAYVDSNSFALVVTESDTNFADLIDDDAKD